MPFPTNNASQNIEPGKVPGLSKPVRPAFPKEPVEEEFNQPLTGTQATDEALLEKEEEYEEATVPEVEVFIGESKTTQQYLEFIEICFHTQNVAYFEGLPGVGKTALINAVGAKRKMFIRTLIGSQMEPQDLAGLPVLKELPTGEMITEFTKPYWFYEVEQYALAHDEGAIIFLDEITTAPPPVQAGMLTFIQDRRIGKFKLPDNVMLVAAGNPPHAAADGNQLAPPTANRFAHIAYEPSIPDWLAGMGVAFNRQNLGENEKRQRSFLIAFLQQNTNLVNKMPEDPEEASQAWPSMRSWDNAARALGQISSPTMAKFTLDAFVGKEASNEYMVWADGLKLPDLNMILSDPHNFDWRSLKSDALYLLLSNTIDIMDYSTVETVVEVFQAARKARKNDILYSLHPAFSRSVRKVADAAGEDSRQLRLTIATLFNDIQKELR